MKVLIEKLQEFNYAQIDKFVKRIFKHPDNSVTNDKQFYNSIRESYKAVEEHLIEEFCEFFCFDKETYDYICQKVIQFNYENRLHDNKEELVDIANLAFLIWCITD